ncbi:hypothetical protein AB0F96_07915 [Streptomyces sp. NPDC023998]|uniref:hypothetical protein n=1 Tax=Streptomyces sp. NPDC023998 TaxID=3154597 RepID=UPI003411CF47
MLSFLEGISKRLTDRILVDAVLPGLVWIAALRFALTIGHVHPADLSAVSRRVQELWTGLGTRGTGSGVVLVIVLAVAAYVVAQVTAGLSLVVRRCWLDEGRLRFLAPLRRHRRERWTSERNAAEAARDAGDLAAADVHDAARNAIAWAEPQCASWMGDRMAALESRLRAEHGLDLVSAWPAIWFLVAENIREEISAADEGFRKAVSVSAWGLLFAPLGLWCWPIGLVGAVVYAVGLYRARGHLDTLARSADVVVDLSMGQLAEAMGVNPGEENPQRGLEITARIRKGA